MGKDNLEVYDKVYDKGDKKILTGVFSDEGKIKFNRDSDPRFSRVILKKADSGMKFWCVMEDDDGKMIGEDVHPLKTNIEFPDDALSIQIRKLGVDGYCKFILE